jgi:hypothetical protein
MPPGHIPPGASIMPPLLDLEDVARFTNRNRLGPVTDCRKKSCAKKLPADMKELPSFPLLIQDDRQFSPHTVITCFVRSVTYRQEKYQGKQGKYFNAIRYIEQPIFS